MRMNMYAIFDSDSGIYMGPVKFHSDRSAIRWFGDQCCSAETEFGKHPECYTLMAVGMFDDNEGMPEGKTPTKVINGLECVAMSQGKPVEDTTQ